MSEQLDLQRLEDRVRELERKVRDLERGRVVNADARRIDPRHSPSSSDRRG